MTLEKAKAIEIIEKFHQQMYSIHDKDAKLVCYLHKAIPCALICVELIINNLSFSGSFAETKSWNNEIVFWNKVKEEIQKND
jgi:hypothetical protein